MKKFLALAALLTAVAQANAQNVFFDLRGTAGFGLLPGNEPGSLNGTPGTGGEIGNGIIYDLGAHTLDIRNIGWGSSQGFIDLSSTATLSHIHGPVATAFGNGFTETTGVLFTLTRSSSAVSGGTFTTAPITLTAAQEADLFNGKYYVNIHTSLNGGGELRGFLVTAVPEPSTFVLGGLGALAIGFFVRRTRA